MIEQADSIFVKLRACWNFKIIPLRSFVKVQPRYYPISRVELALA